MIKFEAVLAHSRPAEVSLDQLQPKPKPESEHPADNIAKIVISNETTQEHQSDISTTDNNQALLLSAVDAAENTDSEAETTKEAGFSTQSWVGLETSANLIFPDRYAWDVIVAQRKSDRYFAAQWIFVSPHLTTYLFHATRSLRSFGPTPLLCNPCLSFVPLSLKLD
jgi:hypothetical protein